MHRIDTSTAVAGEFTDGDPLAGIAATEVDAAWHTDLQENVAQAIEGAGIALARGDGTQLLKAIQELAAAAGGAAGSAVDQVGPYGMPSRAALPSADANSLVRSGFYAAPAGAANLPATAAGGELICVGNTAASNADGAQIYIDRTGLTWTRALVAGAWAPWVTLNASRKALLAVNGYSWDPSTGEFIQWGLVQGPFSEGEVNIVFPKSFDACFGIKGWVVNTSADITIGTWIDEVSVAGNAATVLVNRVSSGSSNIPAFKWEARGVRAASP